MPVKDFIVYLDLWHCVSCIRRVRLVWSRTLGSHPGNTGSNPVLGA